MTIKRVVAARKNSAGAFILALSTGKILLGMRSPYVNDPNVWGTFGGGVDPGESIQEGLLRELKEEIGYIGTPLSIEHLWESKRPNFSYHNHLLLVEDEFQTTLDYENSGSLWCDPKNFPRPLHPGCLNALRQPEVRKPILRVLTGISRGVQA